MSTLTDSTVSDALLEKLKVSLAQQGITDVHLSWRRDSSGLAFQRLKVKNIVIRMTVRSDVDLTNSTISDALLEKLEMGLRQQSITDINIGWKRDSNGLVFRRQLKIEEKKGC
ncbi:hypothetical protein KUCAC02_000259 [Chaenocephalus aceratus]|uniref:Uncharacterized protein n=1 Tax=Chaenocephalus aceratus TaxID=36190 RepID=A0ACB9W546_CHAAC|nr:hypothetical protein KUCAC02_000259 [Chaenocephalus aceratus]